MTLAELLAAQGMILVDEAEPVHKRKQAVSGFTLLKPENMMHVRCRGLNQAFVQTNLNLSILTDHQIPMAFVVFVLSMLSSLLC